MQIIETEIEIQAPVSSIWQALVNYEEYHHWNSFCPKLITEGRVGDTLTMTVYMTPGKKPIIQKEEMIAIEPMRLLAWGLNWGVWLKTYRGQELTDLGNGKVRYYTYDTFEGLLSPLVLWLYRKPIQKGFDTLAEGLKAWTEAG